VAGQPEAPGAGQAWHGEHNCGDEQRKKTGILLLAVDR